MNVRTNDLHLNQANKGFRSSCQDWEAAVRTIVNSIDGKNPGAEQLPEQAWEDEEAMWRTTCS